MLNWLKSRFAGPKPAGPPQVLRAFPPDQPTITQSGIRVENGAWHIDANAEEQTIRLFEVENPAVEQCLLTYRAELKAEDLQGRAFLEMWCRMPGRGEFFSKGYKQAVSGTVEWARYEIPFYLKGTRNRTSSSSTLWLRGRAECGYATSSCSRHRSRREGGGRGYHLTVMDWRCANFVELRHGDVRRIHLLRTTMNKGMKKP